jgi:hypothetical protein
MTAHDLIDLIKEVPWIVWLILAAAISSWLRRLWERRARQGEAREAETWPVADGMVQGINVKTEAHDDSHGNTYEARLTYSYSIPENGETEYYSGEYSRTFNDEGLAWDWVRTMQDKRIRVHVRPDRPKVSAVLSADLEAHFPMPQPFSGTPGLAGASGPPSLPGELRGPTEMAAWFAALGFALSLFDHLFRLLAGHPLHPRLSVILWIAFGVLAVPFGLWYQTRAGQSIFGKPKEWARVPAWLRISTYALNLYVGSFWLIDLVLSSSAFHVHWNMQRFEPMSNGAFLALLYGDAAAILYSKLENLEDPYRLAAEQFQPK